MQPSDNAATQQAQWDAFVRALAVQLAAQWPAMPERLGDRYDAFVEHGVQQALKRGLHRAGAAARYVNLWFVWGPLFHDKPGFEWALGLLAAPRERQWGTVHQLVQRSVAELKALPDSRIAPATLVAADQGLIEAYGHWGHPGDLHPANPPAAPHRACDLQGLELRLARAAVDEHYTLTAGAWQRAALAAPAPLRADEAHPLPAMVAVLAHPPGQGAAAQLQLRSHAHAVCDGDVHPALQFSGSHGRWQWLGHETRAVSWPVVALAVDSPGLGSVRAIAEETSPDIFKLDLSVCGLRDEADAWGSQSTCVWAWPAAQWWLQLERQAPALQPVVLGSAPRSGTTRCKLERDGVAEDAAPLRLGFEQGLDLLTGQALQALLGGLAKVQGLSAPQLEGCLALLTGRAALSWGWHLGREGMNGRALMRVVGELDLKAALADLSFEADLDLGPEFGGARARLVLRCQSQAALALPISRESAEPPLLATMLPAVTRFRLPFSAELIPLATDSGALLQAAGACAGALVGEAGLRPRTSGGSGYEWFAGLRLEAVTLPLDVRDPLLGRRGLSLALWPEQSLLDWKLA